MLYLDGVTFVILNFKKHENTLAFYNFIILQGWEGTCSLNHAFCATKTYLLCPGNIMVADGLVMQGAKASATLGNDLVNTEYSNFSTKRAEMINRLQNITLYVLRIILWKHKVIFTFFVRDEWQRPISFALSTPLLLMVWRCKGSGHQR